MSRLIHLGIYGQNKFFNNLVEASKKFVSKFVFIMLAIFIISRIDIEVITRLFALCDLKLFGVI